jgi:hypothetical protein
MRQHYLRKDLAQSYRRFVTGDMFRLSGLDFRVQEGVKKQQGTGAGGDLVLQWLTPSGWVSIGFDALGLIVDFLYENEHHLFPPSQGFDGGEMVRDYVKKACQLGHDKAAAELRLQKAAKRGLFDIDREAS